MAVGFTKQEQAILDNGKNAYKTALRQIYDFFEGEDKVSARDESMSALYRAVALLCDRKGIPVIDYRTLLSSCGEAHGMEDIARLSRFPCRKIMLENDWEKQDCGDFIAFRDAGDKGSEPVVCVRRANGSYSFFEADGTYHWKLTKEEEEKLLPTGYMIYRPLPDSVVNFRGLLRFGLKAVRKADIVVFVVLGILTTLIGMLLPLLTRLIYDFYINLGEKRAVVEICLVILTGNLASLCFGIAKNIAFTRTGNVIKYDIQAAVYDRLFNLPDAKVREFASADLAMRARDIGSIVESFIGIIAGTAFSVVLGLGYVAMMFSYSDRLSTWAIGLLALACAVMIPLLVRQCRCLRKAMNTQGELSSTAFQMIRGVERLKISGAENKAMLRYLTPYINLREYSTKATALAQRIQIIQTVFTSLFSLFLYFSAGSGRADFTTGQFMGFMSAFGAFSGAVFGLLTALSQAGNIRPLIERAIPVLQTAPDYSPTGKIPDHLDGNLEVSHVSFSYREDMPPALQDISFRVHAGEYIGIVGPSGCGKSTLIKLLLAMEEPAQGKIFYDDNDLQKLDKREFRKKLGVVLQNGRVFAGTIFDNITSSAPNATVEEAMDAVRAVGLERDIKAMPMGLHTVLSEGGGTVSGGQQQRILIARAIMGKPNLMLLDEATSALDNVAQKAVCDSLAGLQVTRIVVAHRLSTIRDCDRILVFEKGRIVEEGSYESLMEKKGLFYRMSMRQIAGE